MAGGILFEAAGHDQREHSVAVLFALGAKRGEGIGISLGAVLVLAVPVLDAAKARVGIKTRCLDR